MYDSFVFYRSFYDAIRYAGDEEFTRTMRMILDYALDGVEPDGSAKDLPYSIFTMAKPQIDANITRRENGKKGGRPPKKNHRFSESKTNGYETEKPNVNVNVNENVNVKDRRTKKQNQFLQFEQNKYDFAELEKNLGVRNG